MINPDEFKEERFTIQVEAQKIRELALSVDNELPVFHDRNSARAQGYLDTPAGLTYPMLMLFWGYPRLWDFLKELNIDTSRMLHTGEDYEYDQMIYPGDLLTGIIRLDHFAVIGSMTRISVKCQYYKDETRMCSAVIHLLEIRGE